MTNGHAIKPVHIERVKRPDGKEDVVVYVSKLETQAAIKKHAEQKKGK